MFGIGPVSFLNPLALAGLAAVPLLWWLLRLTPPAPRTFRFPPIMILLRLLPGREISAHAPPWLVVLRLALLLAIIFAAAHPVLDPARKFSGIGPLSLVVDDGWAAAKNWDQRRQTMAKLIEQAGREGRSVIVASTAGSAIKVQPQMMSASAAATASAALLPKPWPVDRGPVLEDLTAQLSGLPPGQIVWLSDGLGTKETDNQIHDLAAQGALSLYIDRPQALPVVLYPPQAKGQKLVLTASRLQGRGRGAYRVLARDAAGVLLDGIEMIFEDGETDAQATLDLPTELRNRLSRLEIEGENSAASVLLMDESWTLRPIGLALPPGATTTDADKTAQPLLSPLYYLERALQPVGDVRTGSLKDLMKRPLAVLVLADHGRLRTADQDRVLLWMENGGVVVRFAGPALAHAIDRGAPAGEDRALLLPAPVRGGARTLGGVLSWDKPVRLAPFAENSPFYGIPVPPDVTVTRQLLAESETASAQKVWARLADGTPLISAARQGRGWLVLIATTADPRWSNLALSGLFVALLDRIVALSQGIDDDLAANGQSPLSPVQTLDGFARLGSPPPHATAIAESDVGGTVAGPIHPPGFYGRGDTAENGSVGYRRALNLSPGLTRLTAFPDSEFDSAFYGERRDVDFRPWLLLLTLALALADLVAMIYLKGLFRRGATIAAVALTVMGSTFAVAETGVPAAVLQTRLAYYMTGDAEQDAKSQAGLRGLSFMVNRRTAAKLGEPIGIDPDADELAFYPLIYWPLGALAEAPSAEVAERINGYLANGGTILFDTLEGDRGGMDLTLMARRLGLPPLAPAGADHVLGRAFYLMKSFPGRWTGGRLWVESTSERVNDGVSPVIVGGNDWAAAWAMDDAGRPLYALVPGGGRQRELSYRFGINLVMYVLTGNYKSDQVHLPSIIERLRR